MTINEVLSKIQLANDLNFVFGIEFWLSVFFDNILHTGSPLMFFITFKYTCSPYKDIYRSVSYERVTCLVHIAVAASAVSIT